MKHVLEIVDLKSHGGTELYVMNIIRNIDPTKFRVSICRFNTLKTPFDKELSIRNVSVFSIPPMGKHIDSIREHFRAFYNILNSEKDIDVIHIHECAAYGCLDAIVAKKRGIYNIIIHSHSSTTKGFFYKLMHYLTRNIISNTASTRLACSTAAGKWMFGNNDFKVIHNAIEVDTFRYNQTLALSMKKEYNIYDSYVIGNIGHLSNNKNQIFLVEVLKELLKRKNKVVLVLIGAGDLKETITRKSKEYGISDSIIMVEKTDRPYVYYQMMDIYTLPSYYEGLSLTAVEAQAAGLNCVFSDTLTRETDICGNNFFASIKSVLDWVRIIEEQINNRLDRVKVSEDNIIKLRECGYDISTWISYIEREYSAD